MIGEGSVDLLRLLESNMEETILELTSSAQQFREWKGRLLASRKNGAVFLLEINMLPVQGADGSLQYVVWVMKDLSFQILAGNNDF